LILGDPGTANDFANRYATGNYTPASADTIYFGCALTALTPYDYASCVKPKSRKKVRN
jgi:hypothetical protein